MNKQQSKILLFEFASKAAIIYEMGADTAYSSIKNDLPQVSADELRRVIECNERKLLFNTPHAKPIVTELAFIQLHAMYLIAMNPEGQYFTDRLESLFLLMAGADKIGRLYYDVCNIENASGPIGRAALLEKACIAEGLPVTNDFERDYIGYLTKALQWYSEFETKYRSELVALEEIGTTYKGQYPYNVTELLDTVIDRNFDPTTNTAADFITLYNEVMAVPEGFSKAAYDAIKQIDAAHREAVTQNAMNIIHS